MTPAGFFLVGAILRRRCVWRVRGIIATGKTQSTGRETSQSATMFTTHLTYTCLRSKSGLCDNRHQQRHGRQADYYCCIETRNAYCYQGTLVVPYRPSDKGRLEVRWSVEKWSGLSGGTGSKGKKPSNWAKYCVWTAALWRNFHDVGNSCVLAKVLKLILGEGWRLNFLKYHIFR